MDRRETLKTLAIGSIGAAALLDACKPGDKPAGKEGAPATADANGGATPGVDRQPEEVAHYRKVTAEKFFDAHEMATIAILADIIIPKDEVSGSATEAGVPDFIEFIVKDIPDHQTPMRGGLRWLDIHSHRRHGKPFTDLSADQRISIVDEIAYPKKASPEVSQGVAFFSLMRNLTASGFYSTQMGNRDIGYVGNAPNQWNGAPKEVLAQYGLAYTEKDERECVRYD